MSEYLSTNQAARILKISRGTIRKHHQAEALPYSIVDNYIAYPRSFIEELAKASNGIPVTRDFVLLFKLAWDYDKNILSRQELLDRLAKLQQQNAILTDKKIAILVGYGFRTIGRWRSRGFLRSVRILRHQTSLAQDVKNLKKFVDGLTKYEMAEILGVHPKSIQRLARLGKLKVRQDPTRTLKATEADVANLLAKRAETAAYTVLSTDAARRLNVPRRAIQDWGNKGLLDRRRVGKNKLYLESEIEDLARYLNTITPGFEWLITTPVDPRQKLLLWPLSKSARYLGIDDSWLNKLSLQGLVPSFPCTPESLAFIRREYVATYIIGLKTYATGRRLTKTVLKEYYAVCQQRQLVA